MKKRVVDDARPPEPVNPWPGALGRMVLSAGTDLWLSITFLVTWFAPYTFGVFTVHRLTYVMLMEFLVVHSSGFLSAIADRDTGVRERAFMFAMLGGVYTLMAAGFSAGYGEIWPCVGFMGLILSRAPHVVLRPPDRRGMDAAMAQWAIMVVLYLGGVFATVMYDVPPLGVTPEVIARQEFGVGGLWPEEPYRVLAFGALYFAGMAAVSVATEALGALRANTPRPANRNGFWSARTRPR